MNEIVIGVKPIAGGSIAENDEDATAAIYCMWMTIDGKEIPTDGQGGLISASTKVANEPLRVTVELIASSFKTARWDGPEAPERWRKKVE